MLSNAAILIAERTPLPDPVTRAGIRYLVGRTDRSLQEEDSLTAARRFCDEMPTFAIAEHTDAANQQHYEVPAKFFQNVLGPRLKYSCCYFEPGDTLAEAEEQALSLTCKHADLRNGQDILELGCGWGSLTLWLATRYPSSHITAVSNSASQRAHILQQAALLRLNNLKVITADINAFNTNKTFDRVVSVEMFEHMSNWPGLLSRVRGWLKPDGRLFVHVFAHDKAPYRFDHANKADFIAQHFFTGGIMPSAPLMGQCAKSFEVEEQWRWSGEQYARTADSWLTNFDAHQDQIMPVLEEVYGSRASLWHRRWRLFFLATSGLFGYRSGTPWGINHYRLRPL